MPFTFSHPAAVLPFSYLPKKWFSLTALVIGSMVPDFEYFIRMKISALYSHTWSGLLWFDLPLGLLIMLMYVAIVKDKLITHLPLWFNRRFSSSRGPAHKTNFFYIVIVIISILIGAASHILWDSFTHPAGYFVKHHHLLRHKTMVLHQHLEFYNILQHLSTIAGAVIIAFTIYRLPEDASTTASRKEILYYWLKIIGTAVLTLTIRILTGLKTVQYGDMIVTVISGLLIGLLLISAVTTSKQTA